MSYQPIQIDGVQSGNQWKHIGLCYCTGGALKHNALPAMRSDGISEGKGYDLTFKRSMILLMVFGRHNYALCEEKG